MIEINATFLVCMISFIVFMLIMNAIFYRPMLKMMKKRDEYINSNYNEAKELSSKADEYTGQYKDGLAKAKEDGRVKLAHDLDAIQKSSFEKIRQEKENSKFKIQQQKEVLNNDKENLKNSINKDEISSAITSKLLG